MADKYVILPASGVLTEREATVASAGAGDTGKIVALDAAGKLDSTVLPTGLGADSLSIVASETITAPAMVNVWNDAGTLKARYADASAASAGKRAWGFVNATIASEASGTVIFDGTVTGLTGLTLGATYFLSGSVPGGITLTAPVTAGHCVQEVGIALSATTLSFEAQQPIIRG